jgi:hypothetical protein
MAHFSIFKHICQNLGQSHKSPRYSRDFDSPELTRTGKLADLGVKQPLDKKITGVPDLAALTNCLKYALCNKVIKWVILLILKQFFCKDKNVLTQKNYLKKSSANRYLV